MALLTATESLTQSVLADRADVSERSLRDHLSDILALGLINETATSGNSSNYRREYSDGNAHPSHTGDRILCDVVESGREAGSSDWI